MLTQERLSQMEQAVRMAGQNMLRAHPEGEAVHLKPGRGNFVTDFDLENQRMLEKAFREILPGSAFLGEEDTGHGHLTRLSDGYTWIVDPIDGTTNFMFDYRCSCVSAGLALDGEMVAAFVYNPYVERMYTGRLHEGAYMNGQRLQMEDREIEEGIVAFGCAGYNEEHTDLLFQALQDIFHRAAAIRSCGSAAWDLSRIASGSNLAYVEMVLQPWDYAAASLIIREAGGEIFTMDGQEVSLVRPSSVIAGTHRTCRAIREILRGRGLTSAC